MTEFKGMHPPAICHRDGTVSYWSVHQQQHVRAAATVPDAELAAMSAPERDRVRVHLALARLGSGMSVSAALRESDHYASLCPHGDQWTIIYRPLPWSEERATSGGTLSWPYHQARSYWRESRARIALELLGVRPVDALGAECPPGESMRDAVTAALLRL